MSPTEYRLQIAKEFASEVKQKTDGFYSRMMLFGSVARGEARKKSDIDILFLVKPTEEYHEWEIYDIVRKFYKKYGIEIEFFSVWDGRGPSYIRSIDDARENFPHIKAALSEGIVIEP